MTTTTGLSDQEKYSIACAVNRLLLQVDRVLHDLPAYEAAAENIFAVVDQIAEARAKGARGLLQKQYDDAEFCAECGMAPYHEHTPGCAIAAELARGKT